MASHESFLILLFFCRALVKAWNPKSLLPTHIMALCKPVHFTLLLAFMGWERRTTWFVFDVLPPKDVTPCGLIFFQDHPHLKEYDNCDPTAAKCQIKPPETEQSWPGSTQRWPRTPRVWKMASLFISKNALKLISSFHSKAFCLFTHFFIFYYIYSTLLHFWFIHIFKK